MLRGARKIGLLLVIFSLCAYSFVFASTTVTDIYDQPSSLKISTASNHKFTAVTSLDILEGDSIVLDFPSGFNLASIIEDDVDITDDGSDLTTASDCLGTEKASVVVVAQTLTIAICAGDGGAISSGSTVVIEIGTNASASGSGLNRITNPASEATYFVWLYTSVSSISGSVPIPIVSDDDGNVSSIIPSTSSGGCSGCGVGGDDDDDVVEEEDEVIDEDDEVVEEEVDEGDEEEEPVTEPDQESEPESEQEPEDEDGEPVSEPEAEEEQDDGASEIQAPEITTEIHVADGQIILDGDEFLPQTQAEVIVYVDYGGEIDQVVAIIDDTTYGLEESSDGVYEGLIPLSDGQQVVTIVVSYGDGQTQAQSQEYESVLSGWVYEVQDDEYLPIEDAVVIIYQGEGASRTQWDARSYGQSNPFITSESGAIAFYVPNGVYTISVGKVGYEDSEIAVSVTNNILSPSIKLERSAQEIIPQSEETITDIAVASSISAFETINEIRLLPIVQTVADIAIPVTVAVAVGSIGALSSSFNLLPFLRYLFSSPALFFARRRRRRVGIIYNAISKVPIDLATIRLFDANGKLVKTTVSDRQGRYIFKANPGIYTLDVKKTGFVFPSEYMLGKDKDALYENIYNRGQIEVKQDDVIISANIPLDPSQDIELHSTKKLLFTRFTRVLCHALAISGLIVAIIIFLIQPTIISGCIVVLHITIYSLTRLLTMWRRTKGWGVVSDAIKQKPLKNTVVRLFEPEFNRLIESTITDGSGRYAFMAGPNNYFITFDHPKYDKNEVRPIDYSGKSEPDLLTVDISLKQKTQSTV